jgi:hypothetical protein
MTVRGAKNLAENVQISEEGSAKPKQAWEICPWGSIFVGKFGETRET